MKHLAFAALASLIAVGISISLHLSGSHDFGALIYLIGGYPGLLANSEYRSLNEALFTIVNRVFYFSLFEVRCY